MNRLVAWTVIAAAGFGLAACAGTAASPASSAPASAPSEPAAPSTAASTTSGQSLAEACVQPSTALAEAGAQLAKASAAIAEPAKSDPEATIKAFTAVVDAFGAMADSATHPEVKDALSGLHKGYGKLRDTLSKVLIDKDYAAAADNAAAAAEVQESLTKFQKLCAG